MVIIDAWTWSKEKHLQKVYFSKVPSFADFRNIALVIQMWFPLSKTVNQ